MSLKVLGLVTFLAIIFYAKGDVDCSNNQTVSDCEFIYSKGTPAVDHELCNDWLHVKSRIINCSDILLQCSSKDGKLKHDVMKMHYKKLESSHFEFCLGTPDVRDCRTYNKCEKLLNGYLGVQHNTTIDGMVYIYFDYLASPLNNHAARDMFCEHVSSTTYPPSFYNCATLFIQCHVNPNGWLDNTTYQEIVENYCSNDCDDISNYTNEALTCAMNPNRNVWELGKLINNETNVDVNSTHCLDLQQIRNCTREAIQNCPVAAAPVAASYTEYEGNLTKAMLTCDLGLMGLTNTFNVSTLIPSITSENRIHSAESGCTKFEDCDIDLYYKFGMNGGSTIEKVGGLHNNLALLLREPLNKHIYCTGYTRLPFLPDWNECVTSMIHCHFNPQSWLDDINYVDLVEDYCSSTCRDLELVSSRIEKCASPKDMDNVWTIGKKVNILNHIDETDELCNKLRDSRDCTTKAIGKCYAMATLIAYSNYDEAGDLAMALKKCNIGMMGLTTKYGNTAEKITDSPIVNKPSYEKPEYCSSAPIKTALEECEKLYEEVGLEEPKKPDLNDLLEFCGDWHDGIQLKKNFADCSEILLDCSSSVRQYKSDRLVMTMHFLEDYYKIVCVGVDNVRDCSKYNQCDSLINNFLLVDWDTKISKMQESKMFLASPMLGIASNKAIFCNIYNPNVIPAGFLNCITLMMQCFYNPQGWLDRVSFADLLTNYCSQDCSSFDTTTMAISECAESSYNDTVWSLGNQVNNLKEAITQDHELCSKLNLIGNCTENAIGKCSAAAAVVANSNEYESGNLTNALETCNIGVMGLTNYYNSKTETPSITSENKIIQEDPSCIISYNCKLKLLERFQVNSDSSVKQIAEIMSYIMQPINDPTFIDLVDFCAGYVSLTLTPEDQTCITSMMRCEYNPQRWCDKVNYEEIVKDFCSSNCSNTVEKEERITECASPSGEDTVWTIGKEVNKYEEISEEHHLCKKLKDIRKCTSDAIGKCYPMATVVAKSNRNEYGDLAAALKKCNIGMMGLTTVYGNTTEELYIKQIKPATEKPKASSADIAGSACKLLYFIGFILFVIFY